MSPSSNDGAARAARVAHAAPAASTLHDGRAHAPRALAMNSVQQASSTHPGAPLGTGWPITGAPPDRVFDSLPALARHVIGSR